MIRVLPNRYASLGLYILLVTTGACHREISRRSAHGQAVRSSGAVRLHPNPRLTVVTDDSSRSELGQIGWALLTAAGGVVIADRSASRLVVLDSVGRLVRTIGRQGSGPGEFRDPAWLGRCHGDSLFVWDRMLDRMSVLTSAGDFVRQFTIAASPIALRCGRSGVLAGLVITDPLVDPRMRADAGLTYGAVLVVGPSGAVLSRVDSLPILRNRPLGSIARLAAGDSTIVFGFPDSAKVTVYSHAGGALGSFHAGITGRTPTGANYEAAVEEILAGLKSPSERVPFRKQFLAIPMPKAVPVFRDLLLDPLGRIWIVTSPLGDADTQIEVRDTHGTKLADLTLPSDLSILDLTMRRLVGLSSDQSGNQRLVVYTYENHMLNSAQVTQSNRIGSHSRLAIQ